MRVAFFSHSAALFGAERSLLDIVLGVRAYGVSPIVVLPRCGALTDELERENVDYIIYPYYWWISRSYKAILGPYRLIANPILARCISWVLRGRGIDIVYSNTLATPVGAMVAKTLGVKHLWHVREFVHEDMGADFYLGTRRAAQFIAKSSSYIIYNSCAVETKFKLLFGNTPGAVIYNGWLIGSGTPKQYRKVLMPEKTIRLCIAGSLHRGKGQHHAIKALSVLKQSFPNMTLDIVGAGNRLYVRELEKLCSEVGVSASVVWSGYVSDVAAVFRRSDISLVCSRNEAFGRVVVEAMAEGCPVVGSRSGGIPEIIEHGVNGLLYNYESIDDLVRQVSVLINNQELYSKIARRGVVDAYKRFSRRRYAEQIHQVLKEL